MKFTARSFAALVSVAAVCCFGGCKSQDKMDSRSSMSMMNNTCPCGGGKANSEMTSSYEGKAVGFCCEGCKSKFDRASHADRMAMMNKAR